MRLFDFSIQLHRGAFKLTNKSKPTQPQFAKSVLMVARHGANQAGSLENFFAPLVESLSPGEGTWRNCG